MALKLFIFIELIAFTLSQDECVFEDASGSNHKLDLRSLMGLNITMREEFVNHLYQYSVCANNFECTYSDGTNMMGMLNQGNVDSSTGCSTVAQFDADVKPSYIDDENTWIFYYNNGHNCTYNSSDPSSRKPRTLELKYVCNDDLDGPFQVETIVEPVPCIYELIIETDLACIERGEGDGDDGNNLGAGWILIIIFIIFMILYCSIGCAIGKCQTIPHFKFWCNLHRYVIAGCEETRDIVCCC